MLRIENFFQDSSYKEIYLKNIDNIENKLKSAVQLNTPLYNFTDHGTNHSDEINTRLTKIFYNLFTNDDTKIKLNNAELYSLISAIYLHDIGMDMLKKDEIISMFTRKNYKNQFHKYLADSVDIKDIELLKENSVEFFDFIRRKHHIISAMWIMSNRQYEGNALYLPLIDSFVLPIALIAFAHNEYIDILTKPFYNNTQVNGEIIQVKFLSYLLRIGDSLHADRSRCNINVLNYKDIPVESKIHWFRHYYTKSISIENQSIDILFEFPDEEGWSEDVEQYFISEAKYWINQNITDITINRLFEDNNRNNLLKCILSDRKEYLYSVRSVDKEIKQKIIEILGNKVQLVVKQEKDIYINTYEYKFNEQLIHNKYDGSLNRSLKDIFVQPRLYEFSEHKKDDGKNRKKKRMDIETLLNDEFNYIISGKQGIGKTTLIRYMFLTTRNSNYVPFIFDFSEIEYNTDNILCKKIKSIIGNDSFKINIDIELQNGNCLLFIDNVNKDSIYFRHILEFCSQYPQNKIIMTQKENEEEEISSLENVFEDKVIMGNIKELFIHYLGIYELRIIVNKWFAGSEKDSYSIFSSIYNYILENNLPRTPLLYSLFLSINEKDSDFIPINIATLFDKFSDIYLGKYANLFYNYRSTYDYNRKKYILKELAKYMVDNNKKKLHISEYYEFIDELFGTNGFGITIDKDELLADLKYSNLFARENDHVKFTFDCFLFFFYAKRVVETDKSSDVLFNNIKIEKFSSIIIFYTGLLMNCSELLEECSLYLLDMTNINKDAINKKVNDIFNDNRKSLFHNIDIKSMNEVEIEESINRQSEHEELIEYTGRKKQEEKFGEQEHSFLTMLIQVCSMLKNSEYIDNKLKTEVLELCIDCYTFILCELICNFEKFSKQEEYSDKITEDLKYSAITLFTLVIESIVHSTIGTSMLEEQLRELMKKSKNVLCDFIYCMLSAELALNGYLEYILNFAKRTQNFLLLDCLLLKLQIIFEERNFNKKPAEKKRMLDIIRFIFEKILKEKNKNARYKDNANRFIENISKRKLAYELKYMPFMIDNK